MKLNVPILSGIEYPNLLQIAISKPLFLEEEFEAEFGNIKEELVGRSNNHFRHLSLALREAYGLITH